MFGWRGCFLLFRRFPLQCSPAASTPASLLRPRLTSRSVHDSDTMVLTPESWFSFIIQKPTEEINIFLNESPKRTTELISNSFIWLLLCTSKSTSPLILIHSSLSFCSLPLAHPAPHRISQKLRTIWLTDVSVEHLQTTVGSWSKRRRCRWPRTGYINTAAFFLSVLSGSAVRERTNCHCTYLMFGNIYTSSCSWSSVGSAAPQI